MRKAPYFTLSDIDITDSKGLYFPKLPKERLYRFLEAVTRKAEDRELPEILRLKAGADREYFVAKEASPHTAGEKIYDASLNTENTI